MAVFNYSSGDPNNLAGGGSASMTDIQGPLVDVKTFLNGQIGDSNLSASAAVNESKLATGSNGLAKGVFGAYRNAAQSIGAGARVDFDTEEFDVSAWNALNVYTPLIAGYYRFSWLVSVSTTMTADTYFQSGLHKNGTAHKWAPRANFRSNLSGIFSGGSALAQANGTTDAFDIRIDHNNGGTVALITGLTFTYFQAELIGRS